MELGAFSITLNVKDIDASKAFYEKLGFVPIAGAVEEKWLVLKNAKHVITSRNRLSSWPYLTDWRATDVEYEKIAMWWIRPDQELAAKPITKPANKKARAGGELCNCVRRNE